MKKEIEGATISFIYRSPVGFITCAFEGDSLVSMTIKPSTKMQQPPAKMTGLPAALQAFRQELDAYFSGKAGRFRQKTLFAIGTAFERQVWKALLEIPAGETRSYKWIAERVGSPNAVRAVGQALGKNPLPIIVPCHRVIASDGSLGGYSGGGVGVKRWLLEHEKGEDKKRRKEKKQ